MGKVAGRFARVEPRRRARAFVLGLLADLPRKNCWTIAEHAGDANPAGMQHLLAGRRGTLIKYGTISGTSWSSTCAMKVPSWSWTRPET